MNEAEYKNFLDLCRNVKETFEKNSRFMEYAKKHDTAAHKEDINTIDSIFDSSYKLYKGICSICNMKPNNGKYNQIELSDDNMDFLSNSNTLLELYDNYVSEHPDIVAKDSEAGKDAKACYELILTVASAKRLILDLKNINSSYYKAIDNANDSKAEIKVYNDAFAAKSKLVATSSMYKTYATIISSNKGSYDNALGNLNIRYNQLKAELDDDYKKRTDAKNLDDELKAAESNVKEISEKLNNATLEYTTVQEQLKKYEKTLADLSTYYENVLIKYEEETLPDLKNKLKIATSGKSSLLTKYAEINSKIKATGYEDAQIQIADYTSKIEAYSLLTRYNNDILALTSEPNARANVNVLANIHNFYQLRNYQLNPNSIGNVNPTALPKMEDLLQTKEIQMILDIEQKCNVTDTHTANSVYYSFDELQKTLKMNIDARKEYNKFNIDQLNALKSKFNEKDTAKIKNLLAQRQDIQNKMDTADKSASELEQKIAFMNNEYETAKANFDKEYAAVKPINEKLQKKAPILLEEINSLRNNLVTANTKKDAVKNNINLVALKDKAYIDKVQQDFVSVSSQIELLKNVHDDISTDIANRKQFVKNMKTHNEHMKNLKADKFKLSDHENTIDVLKNIKKGMTSNDKTTHSNSNEFNSMMTSVENLLNAYETNANIEQQLILCATAAQKYENAKHSEWIEIFGKNSGSNQRLTRLHFTDMLKKFCNNELTVQGSVPELSSVNNLLSQVSINNDVISANDIPENYTVDQMLGDMNKAGNVPNKDVKDANELNKGKVELNKEVPVFAK